MFINTRKTCFIIKIYVFIAYRINYYVLAYVDNLTIWVKQSAIYCIIPRWRSLSSLNLRTETFPSRMNPAKLLPADTSWTFDFGHTDRIPHLPCLTSSGFTSPKPSLTCAPQKHNMTTADARDDRTPEESLFSLPSRTDAHTDTKLKANTKVKQKIVGFRLNETCSISHKMKVCGKWMIS